MKDTRTQRTARITSFSLSNRNIAKGQGHPIHPIHSVAILLRKGDMRVCSIPTNEWRKRCHYPFSRIAAARQSLRSAPRQLRHPTPKPTYRLRPNLTCSSCSLASRKRAARRRPRGMSWRNTWHSATSSPMNQQTMTKREAAIAMRKLAAALPTQGVWSTPRQVMTTTAASLLSFCCPLSGGSVTSETRPVVHRGGG